MWQEPRLVFYSSLQRVDSIDFVVTALSRNYLTGLALALLAASCSDRPSSARDRTRERRRAGSEEWFTDRARESGLDFVHFNGMTGRFIFPKSYRPALRCSTTTATAISMCSCRRDRCSERRRSARRCTRRKAR